MQRVFILFIFILVLLAQFSLHAATIEDKISGLYVAFFNRAADKSGMDYWTEQSTTLGDSSAVSTLAKGFSSHPKYTSLYAKLNNQEYVEAVYQNTLGQVGDVAGILYWSGLIDNGLSRSDMVADFVSIALDFDSSAPQYSSLSEGELSSAQQRRDLLSNKVAVSNNFINKFGDKSNLSSTTDVNDSASLDADIVYMASVNILSEITDLQFTKTTALNLIDEISSEKSPASIINDIVSQTGGISNYESVLSSLINSTSKSLPIGLEMINILGGSFIMGNNSLKGPQEGKATEHSVNLSDFQLSETEVTNTQYVEYLNSALVDGLVEVKTITDPGPDINKTLIVGTSSSSYADKVLYDLEGTRVMKDHDNSDNDDNEFTGVIEPENPLNIAYIAYNSSGKKFYIKDPHSSSDFHWYNICNYSDYSKTPLTTESEVKNDFNNWSELNGWTESNPSGATGLPTKAEISGYPVSFIRWWGAYAFANYYGLKLPSEAQWEYAAKGGSNFVYAVHDGADVADANWNQNSEHPALHHLRSAKSGQANPYGLFNLGGNAWEWMYDNYQAYEAGSVTDPLIEVSDSTTRSWRGGSWNYHQATLETSARYYDDENRGNDHFGFRVAK